MFTYVELTNFKSFGKIRFDFKKNKKEAKKFIAIYGENGSGKSNFVSSIELLSNLMTSFSSRKQLQELQNIIEKNENDSKIKLAALIKSLRLEEVATNFKKYRMIDCPDISTVKYGFIIDGIEGYYSVSFNDESIVKEELYYLANKQRGKLFSISEGENNTIEYNVYSQLFNNEEYEKQIDSTIQMYWGKHSFLSLILEEQKDKNKKFIIENISENLLKVISCFMCVFILCKSSRTQSIGIISGSNIRIRDFENVEIDVSDKKKAKQLKVIESIIKNFFTQAYADIIDVYYEREFSPDNSKKTDTYTLFVKKIIAGKPRVIPFSLESAGTQSVLSVLRAILEAVNGQTVVYDEIDNGIHDLLISNILTSVQNDITGQLIITTHNTLLLEEIDTPSAYVIYTDINGNKEARCFDDYSIRVQTSNNKRRLYLNGAFGGVPYSSEIDYSNMHINQIVTEE